MRFLCREDFRRTSDTRRAGAGELSDKISWGCWLRSGGWADPPTVSPQNLQKAPKTPIARPSITPILRMDQVSSVYNPGNDFFWREEGPCRARARTSPARPSLGVPPTRFGGFPVTLLSQTRLNLQVPGALGQPAWFVTIGWTGTSRSQVGVPYPPGCPRF